MSAKRITLDEWIELQRGQDPHFDRDTEAFIKARGPKRKVPLLLDENLEAQVIAELRAVKNLKITLGRPSASDEAVLAEARRARQVIVTTDMDFWDDHRFPLAQSPGVIVVSGRNAEEKIESLATAFVLWDIDESWRKVPASWTAQNSRHPPAALAVST